MANRKPSAQETGDQPGQDVLVGYQMAIALWTHEGAQNGSRFNMMLLANSIIMVVLGLAVSSDSSTLVAALVLSVIGIILCAAWFLITKRSFAYQNYYAKSAREIEETHLAGTVQTLARGGMFAEGERVSITIDGETEPVQMSALSGVITAETGALVVIGVFFGLDILLALLTVVQMARGLFYY